MNLLDGSYTYTPSGQQTSLNEEIGYTLVDGDGDSDSAVLSIDILPADALPTPSFYTNSNDANVIANFTGNNRDLTGGLTTGSGDDIINVDDYIESDVSTGAGDDTIFIRDDLKDNASIDTGSGDDILVFENGTGNASTANAGSVDLGVGTDTITFVTGNSDDFTFAINNGVLSITSTVGQNIDFEVENVEHLYFGGDDKTFDVGATSVTESQLVQQGIFIDGIVSGLAYTTSSGLTGFTDESGKFNYVEGDTITFSIGNVVLGSADSSMLQNEQLFLQDLANVDRTDVNDEYVENMAVLLQSIDVDGDAYNGITITAAMHDAFSDDNFDLATISEEQLVSIIEETGHEALTEDEAMQHVQDMLELHANIDASEFDQRVDDTVDVLVGSEGADTFVWLEGDTGVDHITNFNLDEGDALDLSDVLHFNEGDNLDDFIDFDSDGQDTTITVHADGGSEITQTIVLDGVDLGSDDATIINDMFSGDHKGALFISNNNVKVDDNLIISISNDSLE